MRGGFGAGFVKGALLSLAGAGALSLAVPFDATDPGTKTQVELPTPAGSGFNAERTDTNPVLPDTDQSVVTEELRQPTAAAGDPIDPVADTASAAQPDAVGGVEMPMVEPGSDELAMVTPGEDVAPLTDTPVLGVPMPAIENPVAEIPVNQLPVIEPPTTEITEPPAVEGADDGAVERTPAEPLIPAASANPGGENAALMRNRIVFENPDAKPLMSIILVDAGDEGLDREVLLTFTFPVTFAVAADKDDATATAMALSHGGFEIVAMAPAGETALEAAENAADIETALAGVFADIPQAVGLIDQTSAGLQKSTALADQVITALGQSGHGLLTYDIGLNSTDIRARREGVAAGVVYRVLDSERESGTVIKRYLDRAVLEAGKNGQVIVLGRTYPETVTALFSWALSAKSATVALAPVSATLLAR